MKEIKYVITDPLGIHARPAGLLVKQAAGFASTITIDNGVKKADEHGYQTGSRSDCNC